MRRTHIVRAAAGALGALALTGAGTLAVRGQSTQPTEALSSAALADLPIRLSRTGEIKPTGRTRAFDLVARRAPWELLPGVAVQAVTYNGSVPGPTLRVTEGDTVRVTLRNELNQDTSIHWHGLHVPAAMDGVPGVTQPPVRPGETFTYEFTASHAGTFMYHPHANSAEQIDNGLYGLFVIDPQEPDQTRFDREFTMMLGAWQVTPAAAGGTSGMGGMDGGAHSGADGSNHAAMMRELVTAGPGDPRVQQMAGMMGATPEQAVEMMRGMLSMAQTMDAHGMGGMAGGLAQAAPGGRGMAGMNMNYNYFTINGKAFPATTPWAVKQGDLVRVRVVNISNLVHPMHLHGHDMKLIAQDGEAIRPEQQRVVNTLSVNAGETYDVAFRANNPGTWVFHCHELHHVENDGAEPGGLLQVIRYEGVPPTYAPPPPAAPGAASTQTTPGAPGMPRMPGMPQSMPGMNH
jgi:manganese oxidase